MCGVGSVLHDELYGGDGDLFVVLGVWCCEGFNVKL